MNKGPNHDVASEPEARGALGSELVPKWAPLLADIREVLAAHSLRTLRMDEQQAQRDAAGKTIELANFFGGRFIYLPNGQSLKRAMRDQDIYRRHVDHGEHPGALAQAFGLSEMTVYSILKRQRIITQRRNAVDAKQPAVDPSRSPLD
jgi:Mor family transcriptional regulator